MSSPYVENRRYDEAPVWRDCRPLLVSLDMELTERCNNDCIHCYINRNAGDRSAQKAELSLKTIQAILLEAVSQGCLTVRFSGGEPLLREDFDDIYVAARELGLKVILYTNATLITPHRARLFSRIPLLEPIEITVYGMHPNTCRTITRNPMAYEAARRGIDLLTAQGVPFRLKGVLLPQTWSEADAFSTWTAGLPGTTDTAPSYSMFLDFRCRRDSEAKNRSIAKLRLPPAKVNQFYFSKQGGILETLQACGTRFSQTRGNRLFGCGAGIGSGCIDAYGNFLLCMALKHPRYRYRLENGSLKHALTDFVSQKRKITAANRAYIERCGSCFLRGICEQCPAKSWMEHGDLDTPVEYLCRIAHHRAFTLGLLRSGERAWEASDGDQRLAALAATANQPEG
jgi:radical SAM protein with 4Fe4S-binding SPASM domain